jgi:hypothetical protein
MTPETAEPLRGCPSNSRLEFSSGWRGESVQHPKRRASLDALKVEQAESREFEEELRGIGKRRLFRSKEKTRKAMQRRAEAKAAFNEAMETFQQRQSVLIPKR